MSAQMFQQLLSEIQTLEVQKEDCEAEIRRLQKRLRAFEEKYDREVLNSTAKQDKTVLLAAKGKTGKELEDALDFLGEGGPGDAGLDFLDSGGGAGAAAGVDVGAPGGGTFDPFDDFLGSATGRVESYGQRERRARDAKWALEEAEAKEAERIAGGGKKKKMHTEEDCVQQ